MFKLISLLLLSIMSCASLDPSLSHLPINTQFTIAVKNGRSEIVAEILQNKNYTIDVNKLESGKTQLARAAIRSLLYTKTFMDIFFDNPYVEVIKLLVAHGADPCKTNLRMSGLFYPKWYPATPQDQYLHAAIIPRDDILAMLKCPN